MIVSNSRVHDSLWSCVDVFSTGNKVVNNEIYHCWHQAVGVKVLGPNEILNNTIHDAQLGVNCEHGANPTIMANRFEAAPVGADCPAGVGNTETARAADVAGGTYGGQLVYPAPSP